ncbi:MAG: hypothetical protein ACI8VT_004044, partial [Saprospiraceae bacterium]
EAVTIWYITQSEMAGNSKFIAITVSIISMILVIAVLELGGRKFLQVLTRAIVWKRLKSSWYVALFAIVAVVTIGMGVISFNLSTNGIHHTFVSNVQTVANFDDSDLKNEFRTNAKEITARFDKDFSMTKANYDDRIISTNNQYEARISAAQLKADQYHQKYNSGLKWAKSQADKYLKQITSLEAEKTALIASLQEEHAGKLESSQTGRDKAIAEERSRLNVASEKGQTALLKVYGRKSKKANFWGSLFSFFVGFSVILAFICIISVEVFRRGAGIEVTYEEEEKDLSIPELFWNGLKARFENFFRKRVERFAKISNPARPGNVIGFNAHRNFATNEVSPEMRDDQSTVK